MNSNGNIPAARGRIARIRCLQDCITSLRQRKPFPDHLCYVPSELEYTTSCKTTWKLLSAPAKSAPVMHEMSATPSSRLIVSGEDLCNADGKWLRVLKTRTCSSDEYEPVPGESLWLLLFSSRSSTEETPSAVPVQDYVAGQNKNRNNLMKQIPKIKSWEGVIEEVYSPVLKKHRGQIVAPDEEAVERLKFLDKKWTLDHDAALVQLMSQNIPRETDNLGCLRGFVEAIGVSSYASVDGESSNLTDDNPNTYWETDGSQGQHWIRLTMKKGTIIKYLALVVNLADDNYLPETISVVAGEADDIKVLNNININWSTQSQTEIKLLENLTEHYTIITVRIKSCKSHGIDTRIRGIKLNCLEERSLGFDQEFFSGERLVRFPLLQSFSPTVNYRRSVVLQRFIWLLDSVIHYLIPAWQSSIESCNHSDIKNLANLESIRQLLPLSKKRLALIDTLLKGSSSDPSERKIVYINRHAAFEHRANPSSDFSNTVFMQLYEGLKPRDRVSSPLTYRWSAQNDQWWECKFLSEGIIDQGGGFRDSLSDIAEEMCPSDPDAPMALPFFVRTPNQTNDDGNVNRDCYIPNPSCLCLDKFEWIGQLMGACFRGKEILIVSLAPYVWKRLVGESYSWTQDFPTVDAAEVRLIDSLVNMDRETFLAAGRSWSMVLSDGSHVSIRVDDDGNPKPLSYDEREEYVLKVREIRLGECDKQLKAMRSGLLKVIPEAVLELLTWQELETRICGQPDITVEALMKSTFYHHIDEDDIRVKYFWSAVKNFSNEDRSRLLRFISGRRRLPVSIFISSGKNSPVNPLPESSTCCNTLHLPVYTDEKTAEDRLRYAAYNCVSIDTDE
ncbi:E3 ubiquitin-protein ligase HECTD3-like [Physella acuta]|uniref:E3 ubiquitin-protein ligase HECTD3-like n=1 Tax=Physella acuta TaxID=109671 RepID=UPI0027DCACAC|nr:E3 ubiquitin-protein ligase HECTD3-like [Physella acuta]XP_059151601.1 E3 ubiquitin-protein ligase HECTD3-like [Physella acuta]XP_059151602.1 E3 ubiquitin-protein ligase HECTD3-like [Physella acuta]